MSNAKIFGGAPVRNFEEDDRRAIALSMETAGLENISGSPEVGDQQESVNSSAMEITGESLHPVTKKVLLETEAGTLNRGKKLDGQYSEAVWSLLKGEAAYINYDEQYADYITINPDGSGTIECIITDECFEFQNWDLREYSQIGEGRFIMSIKEALDFVLRVGNAIPSGNLRDMGGLKGLIDSYLDVKEAEAHAKLVAADPEKAKRNGWLSENIPTPYVTARAQEE